MNNSLYDDDDLKNSYNLVDLNNDISKYDDIDVTGIYLDKINRRVHKNIPNFRKLSWHSKTAMDHSIDMMCKSVDFSKVKKWVDVGCGTGEYFEYVMNNIDNNIEYFVGLDITKPFLDIFDENIKKYNIKYMLSECDVINNTDINGLLGNESFDLVTCNGVIQSISIYSLTSFIDNFYSINKDNNSMYYLSTLKYRSRRLVKDLYRFKEDELIFFMKKNGILDNIETNIWDIDFISIYGERNVNSLKNTGVAND